MLSPRPDAIRSQLKSSSRVPVYKTFVSDKLTPVSAYLNLSEGGRRKGFLLESVDKGQQLARYSFLGVDPAGEVLWTEDDCKLNGDFDVNDPSTPFELIKQIKSEWDVPTPDELPDFTGGLVGYMGYELVNHIESTVPVKSSNSSYTFPDLYLYLVDKMIVFDHVKRTVHVVGHVDNRSDLETQLQELGNEFDEIVEALRDTESAPTIQTTDKDIEDRLTSNFTKEEYEDSVREIKEAICSGEIFQAVLSQRLTIQDENHPLNLYRCLRSLNPSPYMYYLDFDEYQLVGSSPEILVQKEGDQARVRPIAGTRRRGDTTAEDQALAKELQSDEKELAEHTMLVDLGRNDLGRVCRAGSVNVTEQAIIERYSHVMHMVSNVEGKLREEADLVDLLKATFPAGTVTGAPKVRAMQIIESLEPDRRGPYAGAVGYLSYQENLDTCIVIRTILKERDSLHIQAGAGIVADSDPSREYEETREKARALVQTVETLEDTDFL